MLTEEQIKKLKPGDPIVIHTTFVRSDAEGDIYYKAQSFSGRNYVYFISPDCVSLPTEHKTVVDARDIFRNMSEGEKAMVDNFLSSYFRETNKQEKMRNALKKMGIDLTNIRPKHDPTRLFKKGDKVRVVEWNGRKNIRNGMIGEVVSDEFSCKVELAIDGWTKDVFYPACHLELVTPVEELEPYFIYESKEEESFDIMKRVGKLNLTRNCIYYKTEINDHAELTREEAKAAAEAECDRLNAEYRKENQK